MKNTKGIRPAWIEINLDNLLHNVKEIESNLKENTKIMAVVKADAYGHGAVEISKALALYGIEYFAVSTVNEAIELRNNGIDKFILILGITDKSEINKIVKYDLVPSVIEYDFLELLNKCAEENNKKVKIHIRVDCGKGNIGIPLENIEALISEAKSLYNIEIDGVYTHFYSCYGKDETLINNHIENFENTLSKLTIRPRLIHAASSPAIVNYNQCQHNMVRVGNLLYGISPELDNNYYEKDKSYKNYKPVMALKSRVIDIKEICSGPFLHYGHFTEIKDKATLAYIPLGYADGLALIYLDKMEVLVNGQRTNVFGKVFMDYFTIDITDKADVKIGDEVVIFGYQKDKLITVEEFAYKIRVEKNEKDEKIILDKRVSRAAICLLSDRLERIYIEKNKVKSIGCNNEVNL